MGLIIHNLYICYIKVGKLVFHEWDFSNSLALKIYISMRGDLIKTSHGQVTSMFFLVHNNFFCA